MSSVWKATIFDEFWGDLKKRSFWPESHNKPYQIWKNKLAWCAVSQNYAALFLSISKFKRSTGIHLSEEGQLPRCSPLATCLVSFALILFLREKCVAGVLRFISKLLFLRIIFYKSRQITNVVCWPITNKHTSFQVFWYLFFSKFYLLSILLQSNLDWKILFLDTTFQPLSTTPTLLTGNSTDIQEMGPLKAQIFGADMVIENTIIF